MVRALGFDVAFAPVVDVLPSNGRPGPIGADHRAFSTDPEVVAQYGAAYVDAWTSVGMIAVLKHFPGHGGATTDTHRSLAVVPPLATLEHRDLIPFRTILQHAPRGRVAVMVGHLVVPGLTDGAPASVSPAALALLRDTLGFGGPVFSDALDMGAIVHRELPSEAAVRSIGAGVDIVLIAGFRSASAAVQAIASAVPQRISGQRFDEAVDHVLALKGRDPCSLAATD